MTTIQSILVPEAASSSVAASPRYCATRTCRVLYFAEDGIIATKDQARVRVGVKETEDPIPLCYCFGITRSDIVAEVQRTGDSEAPSRIQAEVRAGNCACIRKNPSGSCCLGDVRAAVRTARDASLSGQRS